MSATACADVSDVVDPAFSPFDPYNPQCCIVGGGPAGVMLTLLLGRAGVRVTLLEAHANFDRDFRGDTIHPGTLEVLDQIGLAEPLHQLPHSKMHGLKLVTPERTLQPVNFDRLHTKFPYVMLMPQSRFLDFLADEARKYPHVSIQMGANVQKLIEEDGRVQGVQYRDGDQWREVRAPLTVAADGRFSRVRKMAGFEALGQSPPMDVIWFRLPRQPEDEFDAGAIYVGNGHFFIILERPDEWQIGYAFPKGGFHALKEQGIEKLRGWLAERIPWLADRASLLEDWKQVAVLAVESSRVETWYKPGLLLIGDAAHVMSPVGGVGINYAIGDAVETVNVLAEPLREDAVSVERLAEVQHRREMPVKVIQRFQGILQRLIVGEAIQNDRPFHLPLLMRLMLKVPLVRNIPTRMIAFGSRKVHLEHPEEVRVPAAT